MSVHQARAGESKPVVIIQEVLALWWTRTRARPGEQVKVGTIVKDVKDGAKVVFAVVYKDEVLKTIDAQLQGGKAEGEWKIDLPARDWPDDIVLELDVTVSDKIKSRRSQRPGLHVDVGLPRFSL